MQAASFMDKRATFLVAATDAKDEHGAVREGFTTGSTVWAHLSSPSQSTRLIEGRFASPVLAVLTVHPTSECVAGNRVTVSGATYSILGIDPTGEEYHAYLGSVL